METTLTREMMEALAQPFPAEAIQWKPGATNKEKTRALALAYVDSRWYLDRLDAVAGPDWGDDYEVQPGGTVVLCRLTIAGVTRTDIGEAESNDQNTATSALAQAFKRACARFGLGRYLYRLPKAWEEYDPQRKSFTDAALARLQRLVGGNAALPKPSGDSTQPQPTETQPGGNGNNAQPGGNGKVGPTEFWIAVRELGMDKAAAQKIAKGGGTWAEKVAALGG
jgi:hypothetical protein